jgi:hypothetical protein
MCCIILYIVKLVSKKHSHFNSLSSLDNLQTWHWSDGTPVDYTNWEPGEPNDNTGREFCVEMDSSIGQWNDVECEVDRIFACKAPKGELCHLLSICF